MKKVFSGLFLILFTFTLQAGTGRVIDDNYKTEGSCNDLLTIIVYKNDFEKVINSRKKDIKSPKVKAKTIKGKVFSDNMIIKKLGYYPMNIYTRTENIVEDFAESQIRESTIDQVKEAKFI